MRTVISMTVLALAARAGATPPPNDCGDARLAKVRHYPLQLVSQQDGVKVQIQWKMKIAGHEECGTVDVPWQGSLPRGNYNLVVSVAGKVVAQVGVSLGATSKVRVVDVTPGKR